MIANLTAVMDGIAALLTTADYTKNNYAYPQDSVNVPCTIVGYPTDITFDMTFGRGGDTMVLPVWFVVGQSTTKDARDRLSTILGDATSIKSTLDGAQSFGDVRVTNAQITRVTIAGVEHLAAEFQVEVI